MDDAVRTLKFSQMTDGGDLSIDNKTPGLLSGANVLFNNPLPPLPTGTTAERPPLDASMYLRLRFNTTLQSFEFYNPTLAQWVQLQDSVDIAEFPFLIYSPEPLLPNAFDIGTLSSGILRQTVAAGVSTPAIATNGIDYYGPGFTGYFVSPSGIADVNNRPIIHVNTAGITSVNYIGFTNSLSTLPVLMQPEGTDVNIGYNIYSKGLGVGSFGSRSLTNQFQYLSGTNLQHHTFFNFPSTAATRTVTWQDVSGTVAYIADVGVTSITGTANQVLANGTFGSPIAGAVTLTTPQDIALTSSPQFNNIHLSGGTILTPGNDELLGLFTSALPVNYFFMSASDTGDSIAMGALGSDANIDVDYAAKGTGQHGLFSQNNTPLVIYSGTATQHQTNFIFPNTANIRNVTYQDSSGTLAYTSLLGGGTNASLTASNGGIVYSTASSMAILNGTATANLPVLSGSSSDPSWGAFPLVLGGALTSAAAHTMSGAFASTFTFTGITNVTFPNSGTLATTAGTVSSVSGTANRITSTGGTTPIIDISASYVGQSSITTLGTISTGTWHGSLIPLQFGGTNANLTANNGGVVSSTGSALSIVSGTVTAGQMFQSGASVPGSWTTNTWPSTSPANNLLYATSANTIGNLAASGARGVLTTDASSVLSWLTTYTTYTPTITFFVPGDLSVAYTTQDGRYWRFGNLVITRLLIAFTPTYTTASGFIQILLPFPVSVNGFVGGSFAVSLGASQANFIFPTGTTQITPIALNGGGSLFALQGCGTGVTTRVDNLSLLTGVSQSFSIFCAYIAT